MINEIGGLRFAYPPYTLLFLPVSCIMVRRDGQEPHEIPIAIGDSTSRLGNAQRIDRTDSGQGRDADDLLPFQAVVAIDLDPGHLP